MIPPTIGCCHSKPIVPTASPSLILLTVPFLQASSKRSSLAFVFATVWPVTGRLLCYSVSRLLGKYDAVDVGKHALRLLLPFHGRDYRAVLHTYDEGEVVQQNERVP